MDEPLLTLVVPGKPQPQGSATAYVVWKERKGPNRWKWVPARRKDGSIIVNVTSDNDELKAFRKRVAEAARKVRPAGPMAGHGFTIEYVSYFKRREADWGTGRSAHLLKPGVEARPVREPRGGGAPDVDKLLRAALDALSGVVWADDSQVTDAITRKRFAVPGPDGDGIRLEARIWLNDVQVAEDLPLEERTRYVPARAAPTGELALPV